MCSKCDEIDFKTARYRRLRENIADRQVCDAADRLLGELEAEKLALHPAGFPPQLGTAFWQGR